MNFIYIYIYWFTPKYIIGQIYIHFVSLYIDTLDCMVAVAQW